MKMVTCIALLLLAITPFTNARPSLVSQSDIPAANFVSNVLTTSSKHGSTITPEQVAIGFVQDKLRLAAADVSIKNIVPTDATGITSVYFRQKENGIEVINADININVDKSGRVISYGENIFRGSRPTQAPFSSDSALNNPAKTPLEGFISLTKFLNLSENKVSLHIRQNEQSIEDAVLNNRPAYSIIKPAGAKEDVPVRISYLQIDNGLHLELVYSYELQLQNNWYHAHVSTNTGKVMAVTNWVSHAVYRVLKYDDVDPLQNKRENIRVSPGIKASPYGWHSNGKFSYHDTRGNNVWAQQNTKQLHNIMNLYRPSGGSHLRFIFQLYKDRKPIASKDAAITQLFYTTNSIHDILYRYGFNEVSGNFQDNNGNKGGKGGDFVIANAEDEKGINNANFGTPPDGRNGVMNMFLWNITMPHRDGVFDLGIVIHEYGHGLSNRLTGGPANADCLPSGQSGGMGEGWSDVLAIVFRQKPSNKRTDTFLLGVYVFNGQGIRRFPYSTNLTVNPSLFSYLNREHYTEVHSIGEVWAVILLEVYWNLVDTLGFTPDLHSASTSSGNTLFLLLMINGMKLQPCRPTFIQARDAIIQAETVITQGEYACQLWQGFAKRGLGTDAKQFRHRVENGFQVPSQC